MAQQMKPGAMVSKQKTMQGQVKVWVGSVHTWTGGRKDFIVFTSGSVSCYVCTC